MSKFNKMSAVILIDMLLTALSTVISGVLFESSLTVTHRQLAAIVFLNSLCCYFTMSFTGVYRIYGGK